MKKLTLTLSALLLSTAALADNSSQQKLLASYLQNAATIRSEYQRMALGQVKLIVSSAITQKDKEIIVKSEKTSDKQSGETSGSALFGLIHFNFNGFIDLFGGSAGPNSDRKTRVDYTQIITTNADEMAEQQSESQAQLARLKADLTKIYVDNEYDIIRLKERALLMAQQAYQLVQAGVDISLDSTLDTLNLTQEISFQGQQQVSRCVRLKHAATKNYDIENTNYSAGLSIFGLASIKSSGETHSEDIVKTYAYSEETCHSSTNQIKVTGQDTVYWVDLQLLDQSVNSWILAFEQAKVAQPQSSYFPTWGSPYYN